MSAVVVNPARYKTELCRQYVEHGSCRYGEKCQFAHGPVELRTLVRHPRSVIEWLYSSGQLSLAIPPWVGGMGRLPAKNGT